VSIIKKNITNHFSGDLDETVSFGDKSDMLLDIPELPDLTKISNVSTEDLQATKSRNTLLINLYDALCNSLKHYCGIVHQYLSSLDDVYLLISEYSARVIINASYCIVDKL
jgi:hypothetical protein